jgi:heavy metal sensor kinase
MTLRLRLTVYYTLFFALAIALLDSGLYLGVQRLLLRNTLNELRVGVALVQQAYQTDRRVLDAPGGVDIARLRPPEIKDVEAPELYVQVADQRGAVVVRSSNLAGDALPLSAAQAQAALSGKAEQPTQWVGATRVLSAIEPLRLNGKIAGVVQVAQSLRQIDQALRALRWALAGGGLLALLLAARGSLWLAGAALEPIEQVSTTAERIIRASDLKQRVPGSTVNDEVGRLSRTINEMIERMERMFVAQERFTADVAHELRTPLTAIRGNLEILRRGALRDPAMLAESLQDIESETLRLTRMANDLLVLAQADAGVPIRRQNVQLDEVLLEVYRELRPLAGEREWRVDLQDQVAITGDRDRLKQALLNLAANALQHTPANGSVTLSLRRDDERVSLVVVDTGPGIPAEQQAAIFERFFQGDRSRSHTGAGLGLAIVKWVAEAHGGQALVQSEVERGTTFTLELPYTPVEAEEATPASTTASKHLIRPVM